MDHLFILIKFLLADLFWKRNSNVCLFNCEAEHIAKVQGTSPSAARGHCMDTDADSSIYNTKKTRRRLSSPSQEAEPAGLRIFWFIQNEIAHQSH
jgi:hypothetical protein